MGTGNKNVSKTIGRKKFGTLNEYIDSFMAYLHDREFFMTEEHKKIELRNKAIWFYNASAQNSRKRVGYTNPFINIYKCMSSMDMTQDLYSSDMEMMRFTQQW
jgi:hypothetical protein